VIDYAHIHARRLVEPNGTRVRHNHMLADTSAVHAFGDAQTRHAADLDTARALLAAAHPDDALGSAGAAFTRALATALQVQAERIARLGGIASDAGSIARAIAAAYVDVDADNGRALDVEV
jgi:hypothetical protein